MRAEQDVGTVFVLGDHERVVTQSRSLVLNPFDGYAESCRNIMDPTLEETIKEFAAIDGACAAAVLSAETCERLQFLAHILAFPNLQPPFRQLWFLARRPGTVDVPPG